MDAKSLYPSLKKEETATICSLMVVQSGLWLEALDWEEVGIYLVITNSCGSLPADCLPSRKYTSGATPGITTEEVLGPLRRDPNKSKFNPPVRSPTSEESVEMFRLMID